MNLREEGCEPQRSAIVLHGLVHRSIDRTAASLRERVIAPLERLGPVEVFFHSWDVSALHNPRSGEDGEVLDPAAVAKWLPEARGVFESEEEFDDAVDWERWFLRNPMRHCCGSEEEARVTLMNFLRALESQERAWRFFEETRTHRYDRVVVTRGDLRFLEELDVAALCERRCWHGQEKKSDARGDEKEKKSDAHRSPLQDLGIRVPKFHSWGGVNDRFAVGNEESIRIWSNRMKFAQEWLERSNGESSEWLLMKWLEKNRVRVGFLDFVFQRIRANGEVAERDRELKAGGNAAQAEENREVAADEEPGRNMSDPLIRERFLILAREPGAAAENLRKVLEPLGRVEVIVDGPVAAITGARELTDADQSAATGDRRIIWLPDEEAQGFGGLMGRRDELPDVTAWSRAMVHLSRTLRPDEAVWFVEDDVAGDTESFRKLVNDSVSANADLSAVEIFQKEKDLNWYFWHCADGYFAKPWRAFQPLCRVSARLIRKILEFQVTHGRFVFHELLFASLAREHGMRLLDWRQQPGSVACFATFRYRPEIRPIGRGISHPVKDPLVHEAVCLFTDVSACERAAFYDGGKSAGWYLEDFGKWKRLFVTDQPVNVLETGVLDGVSANLMLDELFIHPGSVVHGIDLYDADPENPGMREKVREDFESNAERGGHGGQLHLYEGSSREVLAWMIAAEGFWESFDFIHLDGATDAKEMLADACQAWNLLKPGGILVFGANKREDGNPPQSRPSTGMDAFLSVYRDGLERLCDGKWVAVMKK